MSRKFQVKAVPSRWLETDGRRLDCGPYMSGAIEAKELLNKLSAVKEPLSGLVSGIYHAGRESRTWVDSPEHGTPFMGSTDILAADLSYLPLISKKQVEANLNFKIGKGWTLITRSGTIGRMAYARSDMDGLACSEHVMRVVPDEDKVKPGFIYAYLSSMFGVPLVISGTYGSIIQSIEPHHISDLPVPRLGDIEDQAHELVQRAADLRVEAAKEIKAASARYLAAAGLEDISSYEWLQNSGRIGFTASISKTILRAVNYIPINQRLSEMVKAKSPEWKPLIDVTEPDTLRRCMRFKRIDSEKDYGIELIGQKEISNLVPTGRYVSRNALPNDQLLFVPAGAIMVNSQGGINETDTFSRCQFISDKSSQYLFSEHLLRVIANENVIRCGALFAYLRSNIAFRLLRSCAVGSMLQGFHPDLLAEIPVPIIEESEAKAVDKMIRSAYQKYDDAIDAEDEARVLVENTIKKGGR